MINLEACILGRLEEIQTGQTIKELSAHCNASDAEVLEILEKLRGSVVISRDGNRWLSVTER